MSNLSRKINRKRKWKLGDVVTIDCGKLQERDPNFGVAVSCYVCGTPHKALGLARINGTMNVPLCPTHNGDDAAIMRKFTDRPDCEIVEGGEATREQVFALAEAQDAVKH